MMKTWSHVPLESVASVARGASPRPIASPRWFSEDSTVGWVRIADVGRSDGLMLRTTTQRLSPAGVARSRFLPSGTLILSIAATVGVPIVTGIPACIHDGFVAIENLRGVDQTYLLYTLKSLQNELRAAGQTGSQANVNSDIVKGLQIPLPPITVQEAMATALVDADHLISALARQIAKKQSIKRGIMQQLLTGRTRLRRFTWPWVDVHLGDHVTYVRTVALSRAQLDAVSPLRYLHYGDIHTREAVRLGAASEPMPRVAGRLVSTAGRLQVGDVVFADASEDPDGVGKSVEITSVPQEGLVPGLHTIAARFDKMVLADGFKAYLQFIPAFRGALLRLAAGTKVLATTRAYVSSIDLSLPRVEEQRAIAEVLIDCDTEIASLQHRLRKARSVKEGMMQQLLTGRIRLPIEKDAA